MPTAMHTRWHFASKSNHQDDRAGLAILTGWLSDNPLYTNDVLILQYRPNTAAS
jgi:hypothetical protein